MKNIIIIKKVINKLTNKFKYYEEKRKYLKGVKYNKGDIIHLQRYKSTIDIPIEYYEKIYEFNEEDILKQADLILNHEFNLLGSSIKFLEGIQWNIDFDNGYTWENKFYKDIKTIDYKTNADVKIPWELSRFQHLYILIYSFKITKDKKYIREIENQILDWIKKNPYRGSVNWTCAMDVAIRACNWIVAINFMEKNNILLDEFREIINRSLYEHGEYVFNNLEKNIQNSNNHYIADLVGLIWIGMYFKNSQWRKRITNKWLTYGLKELELEMNNQILEDGVNYEISIPYHCLVTEMIIFTIIMLEKNNKVIDNKMINKIDKMLEFIYCVTKRNGNIPLIGDMDSGRFMLFTTYGIKDKRDFSHLNNIYQDRAWDDSKVKTQNNSIILKDKSGYAIYKTDRYEFITRCGINAMNGQGNHNHNDNLSFELNLEGCDFIVDPGTFCYTRNPKLRNMYRSTSYHNTLYIESIEQNDFNEKQLFKLQDQSKAYYEIVEDNYIKGKIDGYYSKCKLIHERSFEFFNNEIIILDYLKGTISNENISVKLYLDNKINIIQINEKTITLSVNKKNIEITSEHNICIEKAEISPEYGVRVSSNVLNIKLESKSNKIKIRFI